MRRQAAHRGQALFHFSFVNVAFLWTDSQAIVPASALGAATDFTNNMNAPYNCIGGSETQCLPPKCSGEWAGKCINTLGVPPAASWYP